MQIFDDGGRRVWSIGQCPITPFEIAVKIPAKLSKFANPEVHIRELLVKELAHCHTGTRMSFVAKNAPFESKYTTSQSASAQKR